MENIDHLRGSLKKMLIESLGRTINKLLEIVSESSDKYNPIIITSAGFEDVEKRVLKGLISNEALQLQYNIFRDSLLRIIDSLQERDLKKRIVTTNSNLKIKRGTAQYSIPHQMKVNEDAKCLIKIAFNEKLLIEDFQDTNTTKKSIRVAEVMHVQLLDPQKGANFEIRGLSEKEQFLVEDDFTEWVFYVKPLTPGNHKLVLKIAVIEEIKGKERKKEIVLEEEIQVFADEISLDEKILNSLKSLDSEIFIAAVDSAEFEKKNIKAIIANLVSKTNAKRVIILTSFLLLLFAGGGWAINKFAEEYIWWNSSSKNTIESYENYLEKYPDGKYEEDAIWRIIKLKGSLEEEQSYLIRFPDGKYANIAAWDLIARSGSLNDFFDFKQRYPESVHKRSAQEKIDSIIKANAPLLQVKLEEDRIKLLIEKGYPPFNLTFNRFDSTLQNSILARNDSLSISLSALQKNPGKYTFSVRDSFQNEVSKSLDITPAEIKGITKIHALEFNQDIFDLDIIYKGEMIVFDMEIKNTLRSPIKIDNISTNLDGVKFSWKKGEIRGLGSKSVKVRINSNSIKVLDQLFIDSFTVKLKKNIHWYNEQSATITGTVSTTIVDDRDQKVYKITNFGKKIWMAENLDFDVDTYKNRQSLLTCSRARKHNSEITYMWQDAAQGGGQGACPKGWVLPTESDWIDLFKHYGVFDVVVTDTTMTAWNELAKGGISGLNLMPDLYYWTPKSVEQDLAVAIALRSNLNYDTPPMKKKECLNCRCVKRESLRKIKFKK